MHIDKWTPLCYNNFRRFVPSTKKVTRLGVTFLINIELCFCVRAKSPGDDPTLRWINREDWVQAPPAGRPMGRPYLKNKIEDLTRAMPSKKHRQSEVFTFSLKDLTSCLGQNFSACAEIPVGFARGRGGDACIPLSPRQNPPKFCRRQNAARQGDIAIAFNCEILTSITRQQVLWGCGGLSRKKVPRISRRISYPSYSP